MNRTTLIIITCSLLSVISAMLWWNHTRKNMSNVSSIEVCAVQDNLPQKHPQKIQGIVLDLTKIVFTTDEKACAKEIGYANSAYAWWQAPEKVRAQFYEILNILEPIKTQNMYAVDELGKPLPRLITEWFCGTTQGDIIIERINRYLAQQISMQKRDKELMAGIAKAMFNPVSFINTQKLFSEALEFVSKCKKNNLKIYILSNWPIATIDMLKQKYKQFFDMCDNVIISSDIGLLLPDPAAYQTFLNRIPHSVKSHHLVYIDDTKENIHAARNIGMNIIQCPIVNDMPQFNAVQKELEKLIGIKFT